MVSPLPVGASLLAMEVNDYAGYQAPRVIVDDHRWQASSYSGSGAAVGEGASVRPPSQPLRIPTLHA
ncbi:hypothetical protein EMIT0P218_240008 [Pseudomonas sp. IT-P218]